MDLRSPTGQPELLRFINRVRASSMLKKGQPLTRTELAKQTGLSRATIAVLASELLSVGLVEEVGLKASTGGRRPMLLKFNPDAAFALGALLQDHTWSIVVTDLQARVLHQRSAHVSGDSPEAAVVALQEGVHAIAFEMRALGKRLLPAIGLGTPGLVDVSAGIIRTAVDVGWFEVPIQKMVEEALGLSTVVANRSKLGALAELWYGADRGVKDLIYLSVGTGVAAGIIHDGELYLGANSSAGEVGHLTVVPDGPLCPCGNRGCLQQLVSESAIANRTRERLREGYASTLRNLVNDQSDLMTTLSVFEASKQGDRLAQEIVEETAQYLGIAIANLINLLNPELIVLGGPVGFAGHVLLEPLRAEVERRAMAYPASVTEITISNLGSDAGAVGAAVLILERATELLFSRCASSIAATPVPPP